MHTPEEEPPLQDWLNLPGRSQDSLGRQSVWCSPSFVQEPPDAPGPGHNALCCRSHMERPKKRRGRVPAWPDPPLGPSDLPLRASLQRKAASSPRGHSSITDRPGCPAVACRTTGRRGGDPEEILEREAAVSARLQVASGTRRGETVEPHIWSENRTSPGSVTIGEKGPALELARG